LSLVLFTVLKSLHVIFASLWVGGIVLTVVINRGLRRSMPPMDATRTLGVIGRAIQRPMRLSLYLAIVTGVALLLLKGISPTELLSPTFYTTQLGGMLMGKAISVAVVLILLPLHSRLGTEIYKTQDRKTYHYLRIRILAVGWASLIFSILTILFGTGLRIS